MIVNAEVNAAKSEVGDSVFERPRKKSKSKPVVATAAAIILAALGVLARYAPSIHPPTADEREYSGRVTDLTGKPLSGAVIRLLTQGPPPTVLADGGGFYTIRGKVPAGTSVKLTVEMEPFYLPDSRFLADSSQRAIEDIRLQLRPKTTAVVSDMTLPPAKTPPPRIGGHKTPKAAAPDSDDFQSSDLAVDFRSDHTVNDSALSSDIKKDFSLTTNPTLWLKHEDNDTAYVQTLMTVLGQILPGAGYKVVDNAGSDLVLDCRNCASATETFGQLRLAPRADPEHPIWAMIVPRPNRRAGDTASLAFTELKLRRSAILREYKEVLR
jgi:hypothetical protein